MRSESNWAFCCKIMSHDKSILSPGGGGVCVHLKWCCSKADRTDNSVCSRISKRRFLPRATCPKRSWLLFIYFSDFQLQFGRCWGSAGGEGRWLLWVFLWQCLSWLLWGVRTKQSASILPQKFFAIRSPGNSEHRPWSERGSHRHCECWPFWCGWPLPYLPLEQFKT